jgi:Putative prokaryotic signal transducing protein
MRELLRTGDLVRLSYLRALLAEAGIESLVLDANTGSLLPFVIVPRLMVADNDDLSRARQVLLAAGESVDD